MNTHNFSHFQILQWPPNSPDINPVENVRTILIDFVEKRNPQTKEELIAIIQESQRKNGYDVREKLMNSSSRRLALCFENEGNLVEY